MSILNKKNVDYLSQPLFLGEGLGLQRYDKFKYPIFFDLYQKQVGAYWRPEEISLTLDRVQYKELSKTQQHIFTKNILFQTMMDSVVARGVPVFTKHVSNPELEIAMNAWSFFESIHSYSYTYIIKNVYADPSKILDSALEDVEILKRAESVTKAYDDINNEKFSLKEKIYLGLISVNVLEAIRFYVSFVSAFAFAENKQMVGNADIIKLIKRDENLHLTLTQSILKILHTEESEGFVEVSNKLKDEAIQMFLDGVEEEKKWAAYLFQYGSILGLNETIMCQYIEWLADARMKTLGFGKHFGTKNPISWITPWVSSEVTQTAAQESSITSYRKNSSVTDIEDMDFSEFM